MKTPAAAAYCGVSADYLRDLAQDGRGPAIAARLGRGRGGGTFYTREALNAWLARPLSRRRPNPSSTTSDDLKAAA